MRCRLELGEIRMAQVDRDILRQQHWRAALDFEDVLQDDTLGILRLESADRFHIALNDYVLQQQIDRCNVKVQYGWPRPVVYIDDHVRRARRR